MQDTPVVTHYHKSFMTFEEYVDCIDKDISVNIFKVESVKDDKYWKSAEWQDILKKSYKRNQEKCKNEDDWDLAVNTLAYEFFLMC